jgi:chromosome segregation ATPase
MARDGEAHKTLVAERNSLKAEIELKKSMELSTYRSILAEKLREIATRQANFDSAKREVDESLRAIQDNRNSSDSVQRAVYQRHETAKQAIREAGSMLIGGTRSLNLAQKEFDGAERELAQLENKYSELERKVLEAENKHRLSSSLYEASKRK